MQCREPGSTGRVTESNRGQRRDSSESHGFPRPGNLKFSEDAGEEARESHSRRAAHVEHYDGFISFS